MKIVSRIFGIIAIFFAILFCSMSIYRAGIDKDKAEAELTEAKQQIEQFREQAKTMTGETKAYLDGEIANAEKVINEAPKGSTYLIVQIFLGVLLVLSLAFGYFLFRPNLNTVTKFVAAAVIVTLIVYFASPDIARGKYSGLNSRTLALLSGIPVIVAGLFAFLAAKKAVVKVA
ncbi:hypothetical protein HUK80_06045 [Flavobacterium sp. MAH-1]|uniref:DUF4064 domain-containing protein n=1 Tax=Flavobacterium agri TaxID=2743471 RepID=A0A7Y8Y391_9FLAO|nr:hypothetical protein [Flavobacterium agri]NUY80450.1 hypothetical protein [Flavobacterium agri]NYA70475.1 hypothetical protein [Flavobacterium agri]